ncbi:hypothetical protein A8L45_05840 [Veronia pacifica]|uniref:Uncharacterized protein n=1 Tax=Veronia pacifica TaxID=1080227 RepID=A0A1C3EMN6_9GAMM|nr:hypothetical protein A8L45_05840 [Veronia pacifica]
MLRAEVTRLTSIDRNKYFRLLADVEMDGERLTEKLLKDGLIGLITAFSEVTSKCFKMFINVHGEIFLKSQPLYCSWGQF